MARQGQLHGREPSHGRERSRRQVGHRRPVTVATVAAVAVALVSVAGCRTGGPASSTRPSGHAGIPSSSPKATTPTSAVPSTSSPASAMGREGVPAFSHLFVVVMENLGATGAMSVPSLAALAGRYARAPAWYAVSHPSLPNYLALAAGSTFGVSSDCTDCYQSAPNLASQLAAAGVSWGAYFEGMPSSCFLGPQSPDGSYAAKHDPFRYFTDVRSTPGLCAQLQPLTALTAALGAGPAVVPRFVWVTPSMCHSGHDCSATVAGAWLTGFVAAVTASPAWSQGGALVVTWDEGEGDDSGVDPASGAVTGSGGGGRVLTLVVAPGIAPGTVVDGVYDHYSLLRTVEDAFGLPLLGEAAAPGTRPMSAFWAGG